MKKIIVIAAALLLLGFQASAQLVVGGGYAFSSEKTTGVDGTTPFHGFYLGANYRLPLGAGFGLAPGLYASFMFHNETADGGSSIIGYNAIGSDREFALNVPVKLTYTLDLGHDRAVFAFVGPIFQLGITNMTTASRSGNLGIINVHVGDKVNNYDADNGTMNRFNIYLGGGVGVQLGDIIFHMSYDHSLLDIDKSTKYVTSRGGFKLGVGLGF